MADLSRSKLRRDGLNPGELAPDFELPTLNGESITLSGLRGALCLIVFSDPQCAPCDELTPRLVRLSQRTPDIRVLMVSRGPVEDNLEKAQRHRVAFSIALQRHWEVSQRYALFATPAAYLVDEAGLIAAPPALGVDPVLTLLRVAAIRSLLTVS